MACLKPKEMEQRVVFCRLVKGKKWQVARLHKVLEAMMKLWRKQMEDVKQRWAHGLL